MDNTLRIVTLLPLQELWNAAGILSSLRTRSLGAEEIIGLLRKARVRFVIADIGGPLCWIPAAECFSFWKSELRHHLAEPESPMFPDDFPDGYCYFASEWTEEAETFPIIVLEKHH